MLYTRVRSRRAEIIREERENVAEAAIMMRMLVQSDKLRKVEKFLFREQMQGR